MDNKGLEHEMDMKYAGMTKTEFKARYRNHLSSSNNFDKRKSSKFYEFIWDLKIKHINFQISQKIATGQR